MKSNRKTGAGAARHGEPRRTPRHKAGYLAVLAVMLAGLLGGCGRVPTREAPLPPPPPPPAPVAKKKIVLRGVNFESNRSSVRTIDQPILDEAIRLLRDEPQLSVLLAGYADAKESGATKLSKKRAAVVRTYMVNHGIAASRVQIEGFGASDPVASNATADGRAQNRRVEMRVVD